MSSLHPQSALKELIPYRHIASVTPHDTNDLLFPTRALMVGTAGDIAVITVGGETITIPSAVVTANPLLPIAVTRVLNTGTGASNILAAW